MFSVLTGAVVCAGGLAGMYSAGHPAHCSLISPWLIVHGGTTIIGFAMLFEGLFGEADEQE
jgi:hypothetical protein